MGDEVLEVMDVNDLSLRDDFYKPLFWISYSRSVYVYIYLPWLIQN